MAKLIVASIALALLLCAVAVAVPVDPGVGGLAAAGLGASGALWAATLMVLAGPTSRAELVAVVGTKRGRGLVLVVA